MVADRDEVEVSQRNGGHDRGRVVHERLGRDLDLDRPAAGEANLGAPALGDRVEFGVRRDHQPVDLGLDLGGFVEEEARAQLFVLGPQPVKLCAGIVLGSERCDVLRLEIGVGRSGQDARPQSRGNGRRISAHVGRKVSSATAICPLALCALALCAPAARST